MNIYLLRLIINWLGAICLSVLSLFGTNIQENSIQINNQTSNKTTSIVSTIIEHKTIKKYNSTLPNDKTRILVEGVDGITYLEDGIEKSLRTVVDEVIEVGTGPASSYVGNTTGYGPDCVGCSGTVACKTREGTTFNLVTDGLFYNDSQFGSLRVVAADQRVFRCGTVIEIDNGKDEPYLAIVLDTGSGMRSSWENYRLVHVDIAFASENDPGVYAATARNKSVKFNVQRWGW